MTLMPYCREQLIMNKGKRRNIVSVNFPTYSIVSEDLIWGVWGSVVVTLC